MKWRAALEAGGATYKRTCPWIKPDGKPQYSGDRPGIGYESIVACHAPGRSTWNGGGSHGVFIVDKGGDPRTGHQKQKEMNPSYAAVARKRLTTARKQLEMAFVP